MRRVLYIVLALSVALLSVHGAGMAASEDVGADEPTPTKSQEQCDYEHDNSDEPACVLWACDTVAHAVRAHCI